MKISWKRKRRGKSWRLKRLQLSWNPRENKTTHPVAVANTQMTAGWKGATLQLPSFCSMQRRVTNKPQNALTQVKPLPFKSFHGIFTCFFLLSILFVIIPHTNVIYWKHKNAGIGYVSWISSWKRRVCIYFMPTVDFVEQNVEWFTFPIILCLSLDWKLSCISPTIVLESNVGCYSNITAGYVMFYFCWM